MTGAGSARRVCAIHQPHYLPWLRYLDKIARADVFVLLDDAQYSKNGWQNRNRIKGPGGAFTLTVPVRHRFAAPLLEVAVAGDGWRRAHRNALRTSYGRSPGLPRLAAVDELLARPWERLVDLNLALLEVLLRLLDIRTPCVRASELGAGGAATDRLARICRAVGASHYLTGAYAATAYLEPAVLERAGVGLLVHDWSAPGYRQPHPGAGFVPDLSVVDLIAAEGDRAAAVLAAGGSVSSAAPGPADVAAG